MNTFSPAMKQYFMAQMEPTHNARQKALEVFYLSQFLNTPEGQKWKKENMVCNYEDYECPDFLFSTSTGTKVGLEIVDWVNQTKECRATQILLDVAGDICRTIKRERNINLSLIIDIYDPNEWEAETRKDFLKHAYNPGIKHLQANKKEIKKRFLEIILNTPNLTDYPEQKWVEINSQKFKLSFSRSWRDYPNFFVNNISTCWNNPIQAIQDVISDKNKKYTSYTKNCKTCSLLIVPPLYNTGNCLITPEVISSHHFNSKFKKTYILELRDTDGPVVSEIINKKKGLHYIVFKIISLIHRLRALLALKLVL